MAQVITAPPDGDGKTLYMRSTFGVLISTDSGKHFRWLCEEAIGFTGSWDPPIAATRDKRLFIGLEKGLRVTKGGCDVKAVPELEGELVSDLSVQPDGIHAMVVTATAGKPAGLYLENAKGQFVRVGEGPTGYRFDTLDAAPSKPERIYLTGVDYTKKPYGHFFRSDDGGKTLVDTQPKLEKDGTLFLSGIDPKNPDRLYVREIRSEDGFTEILVSEDGGKTFRSTLSRPTALYGFTLAPDGQTLYAVAADAREGLFRSDDRGEHWKSVLKVGLTCLFANRTSIYGCSNPFQKGGYAIGESKDKGEHFLPLAGFAEVQGPVLCDGGPISACVAPWPKIQANLLPGSDDAGPAGVDGGTDPASSDAAAPVPTAPPSASSPSAASAPPAKSGCGCDAGGSPTTPLIPLLGIATLFTISRRKRGSSRVHGGGRSPLG